MKVLYITGSPLKEVLLDSMMPPGEVTLEEESTKPVEAMAVLICPIAK